MRRFAPPAFIIACLVVPLVANANCQPVRGIIPTQNIKESGRIFGSEFWVSVQRSLNMFGDSPIPVDGSQGPKTKSALYLFQKNNALDATGEISSETLIAFSKLWRSKTPVPLFAENPNDIIFSPDFRPTVSLEKGTCHVTLDWGNETKEVTVSLPAEIKDCRLSQFKGVPHYVQSGPIIGIMLDIRATGYKQQQNNGFIAPVIAVRPDRQVTIHTESFVTYGKHNGQQSETPDFPNWDQASDHKGFDFHAIDFAQAYWKNGHNHWMFRPWDESDCDQVE